MAKVDESNDLANIYVRLVGTEDDNSICYMMRGLFAAIGNSDGQSKTNQQFRQGVSVSFGSGPIAGLFIESFERLFKKRIRNRIELRRH